MDGLTEAERYSRGLRDVDFVSKEMGLLGRYSTQEDLERFVSAGGAKFKTNFLKILHRVHEESYPAVFEELEDTADDLRYLRPEYPELRDKIDDVLKVIDEFPKCRSTDSLENRLSLQRNIICGSEALGLAIGAGIFGGWVAHELSAPHYIHSVSALASCLLGLIPGVHLGEKIESYLSNRHEKKISLEGIKNRERFIADVKDYASTKEVYI